ncbi:MAG: pseudouridine synthase [Bacillota bacterium]
MEERLQKLLAKAGLASRRHAEEMISSGRVQVNGQVVTELGSKADPSRDRVVVDGRELSFCQEKRHVLLFKPKGYVTTASDPEGRPTVMDLLMDERSRLFPVGRLDMDTEGLLILTNDGDLAYYLTHPSHEVDKTYLALVQGVPTKTRLRKLARGIELDDGKTAPAKVEALATDGESTWISITIHEGRNRQVRRMLEAVELPVQYLRRTRLAFLTLDGLGPGEYRSLTHDEVERLRALVMKRADDQDRSSMGRG